MTRRRVYVAGVGAITPLGATWRDSLARLAAGDTAVRRVTQFDVDGFPSQVAAWIDGLDGEPDRDGGSDDGGDRRDALVRRAARDALTDAGLGDEPRADDLGAPAERIGVYFGAESGRATPATILALARAAAGGAAFDHRRFAARAAELAGCIDAAAVSPAAVTSRLAGAIGARGPVQTISIACASGAIAIATAARSIRLGRCDVAICGGVGADVDPLMLVGFGKLGALSARGVSRPFDVRRDGFVVGEGAAVVVLTSRRPGLGVEVTGLGMSLDAHHLTAPDPEGAGAARAMTGALRAAGRSSVGYVQAHGTSTPLNDEVEAAAIRRVLGDAADRAAVGSVKGAVGHWVAGAGAIGFLCAVEAVRGTLLPTAGLEQPDPRCPLDHVMGRARRERADGALANSFAFGGANCSLVVEEARP